jgi:hypothetical protein
MSKGFLVQDEPSGLHLGLLFRESLRESLIPRFVLNHTFKHDDDLVVAADHRGPAAADELVVAQVDQSGDWVDPVAHPEDLRRVEHLRYLS